MPEPAQFQQAFGALLEGAGAPADAALARALAVHRNTSAKAVLDALADNFPVTAALVGAEAFTGAALAFHAADPPADPRLCLHGAGLPDFLRGYAPFAELPYLADVAKVERLFVEALFAADAPPLSTGAVTRGIDLAARYALHPATRLARLATPAGTIWRAHQPDADQDGLDRIDWTAETVLVTRPGHAVAVHIVDAHVAAFLARVADGAVLGEAAAAIDPDRLSATFATVLTAGALAEAGPRRGPM